MIKKSALLPIGLTTAFLFGACASNPDIKAKAPETKSETIETAETGPTEVVVFSHGDFDAVLSEYVNEFGMVDYKRLRENREVCDRYIAQLAGSSPVSDPALFPTREHEMAYWMNAYNALMMRAVLDHYPVDSVADIKVAHGVFSRINFPVGGKRMSLDDIEKGVLLKEYDDPRVHWALTCASMSCPRIDQRAFRAENLNERLDREARNFLGSTRAVVVDVKEQRVRVSKYFDWYGKDFGGDAIAYIKPFLSEAQRSKLVKIANPKVSYMDYDWRLNDQNKSWAATR